MNPGFFKAQQAAYQADALWSAELQRLFGRRAGDVRYMKQGQGKEGSELRRRYEAWRAASDAYNVAMQEARGK